MWITFLVYLLNKMDQPVIKLNFTGPLQCPILKTFMQQHEECIMKCYVFFSAGQHCWNAKLPLVKAAEVQQWKCFFVIHLK